jgi:hypothetical protein
VQSISLVEKQIKLDIPRTFAPRKIPQFDPELIKKGKNSLFNVLAAYAQLDLDVGYTQGMNFLAGMILIGCE